MILSVGPFIGSIETELFLFQPFVYWLQKVLKPEKTLISSHGNRAFLYENCKFFPVFEDFTRNEFNQIGPTHTDVSVQDFNIIIKKYKLQIQDITKNNYGSVYYYNLPYVKNAWIPMYKRIYNTIKLPNKNPNYKGKIAFIPAFNEKYSVISKIYDHLCKKYNVVLCGDMKTHIPEKNILLKEPSYFQNVYKKMFEIINSVDCVIVPASHWTLLADFAGTPCFSWGKYNLNTLSSNINIVNKDISSEMLIQMIDRWLNEKIKIKEKKNAVI